MILFEAVKSTELLVARQALAGDEGLYLRAKIAR